MINVYFRSTMLKVITTGGLNSCHYMTWEILEKEQSDEGSNPEHFSFKKIFTLFFIAKLLRVLRSTEKHDFHIKEITILPNVIF